MGHNIDINDYDVHTDLAIELVDKYKEKPCFDNIKVTNIKLSKKEAEKINKKQGTYVTIEFEDITDSENRKNVKTVFIKELKKLISFLNNDSIVLVIGLGNRKSTPDSLGPLVVDNILVTNHLAIYGNMEEGFKRVCALSPGVMGETGIESSDLISNIVNFLKPSLVIVVDALAAGNIERLNKTIQMTDAGINPGSGIGNKRKEVSEDTLNVPVISIGVPTVVDASSIVSDTINYMYKHFAYSKENINNPINKLKVNVNYLNENITIKDIDKKNLFGIVGTLSREDIKKLIFEVLNPIGYNLMVTPKEEDFVIELLSNVISEGINSSLHEKMQWLLHRKFYFWVGLFNVC